MDEKELLKFAEWIEQLQLYAAKLGYDTFPILADDTVQCYMDGNTVEHAFTEMMRPY